MAPNTARRNREGCRMGDKAAARARRLHEIPDAAWREAVRRDGVIRPLAQRERVGRAAVASAALHLGLSVAQVYRLLRAFRDEPVTRSLAKDPGGRRKGERRLPTRVEAVIERAIESF